MAKLVLAGRADCPYFAKAEFLADYLQKNLPNFRVHKITLHPDEWENWLQSTCEQNGWKHTRSPIVWRELVDRGGKGLLLGGFNEFMEHAQHYYFNTSNMMTDLMLKIGEENLITHIEIQKEEEELQRLVNPLQVWITRASAPSCYSLIPLLANGEIFGMAQDISIHLLDSSEQEDILRGVVMEAEDLACPLLRGITMETFSDDTFLLADVIIVLDDFPEQENLSSEDRVRQAAEKCKDYGSLIGCNANEGVKVLVAGSTFVNLKALVILSQLPCELHRNVVALALQLEYEAKAQLAKKLNVNAAVVKDVIVWGNISGVNFLDLHLAKIYQYDGAIWGPPSYSHPLLEVIYDSKWMKNDFFLEWKSRQLHRAGMSAAHAIATVMRFWYQGSPPGEIVSLGVISEGEFGIPEDIVFSMPVKFQDGGWEILSELVIPDELKETLLEATSELIKEKDIAEPFLQESDSSTDQTSDFQIQQENWLVGKRESDLAAAQDSGLPTQSSSFLADCEDSSVPTSQESLQATLKGHAFKRESGLAAPRDSGLPTQSSSYLADCEDSSVPTSQENLQATLKGHAFPTEQDIIQILPYKGSLILSYEDAVPTQNESTILMQQEGTLPTQKESVLQMQQGALPTQRESVLPLQQEGAIPTQRESVLPMQQEGAIPTQSESVLPRQQEGAIPTQKESALLIQQEDTLPTQKASVPPTPKESAAPTKQASSIQTEQAGALSSQQESSTRTNEENDAAR
ncbi:putative malate dehydrogenase 1B [Ambystoma mexicanum]|uniref:putative malate dehydrogenase 1B n=1 Tax=Ambystoma mexicanum TaxID=8296 RepID=UPI0037E74707